MGILLRTQTHGLDADANEHNSDEEHLPLHAPTTPSNLQEGSEPPSVLAVVGEGVSPAVLEADRTRDYRARHGHSLGQGGRHRQHHATFCSVMRAAAGADLLRVRVWVCVWVWGLWVGGWMGQGMRCGGLCWRLTPAPPPAATSQSQP